MADDAPAGSPPAALPPAPMAPAPAPTPAKPAAPAPGPVEAVILAVINRWRDERLGGGPIARSTDAWNQLQAELPGLAAAIVKEI
jgi:hypothetical protein